MSLIPLGFNGELVNALVVGAGNVGTRRALLLLDAGARVRVIAPAISDALETESRRSDRLSLERREYIGGQDIADATIVVAATASHAVNEQIARDAKAANAAVNVADAPENGSFAFLAVHRVGDVAIGVSADGVPNAAGRIRDSIAARIDSKYSDAVKQCSELRNRVLATEGSEQWRRIANDLIDEEFCNSIEQGTFNDKAARWR
ncbi:MAG: bifunctional precorrin-2 dehydrogenase/sirohydrochlorin ferrochelatase [Gemmatimonadaceae bacterium]